MFHPPRIFAPVLLGLAALAAAPASLEDETENYRQLQAMPRERRLALLENLERFDKLAPSEQTAIRKLNAEIAKKDPVDQLRYRSIMRRYHLWVNGLTEDQRQALSEAQSPEGRFALARKFRLKEIESAPSGPRIFGIRTGFYGLLGPYEIAHLLKIWARLPAAKKAELEKQERSKLFPEIRKQGSSLGLSFHWMPHSDDRTFDAQLDENKDFDKLLGRWAKRVDVIPKKGEAAQKRFELRFTEYLYFEKHKPKAVSQQNLERFSASCPNWLHAMIDPLSPDDARTYLTILYRLIYTDSEMPVETKPIKPPASQPSSPTRSGSRKSGSSAGPL